MNPTLPDTRPLIIIDNNLIDDRGHHLAQGRTLANQALAEGRGVHFYAHRDFAGTDLDPRIVIHRVFEISTYEVFAKKLGNADLSSDFEAVFERVAEDHGQSGGIVLMQTSDAHIYRAFARWIETESFARADALVFHVCTCYELRLLPGAAVPAGMVAGHIWRIARAPENGRRVFLWGETERLADYYQLHFRTSAEMLPLPTPQWIREPPADARPDPEKVTLLFLGAAREEKGFLELPDLAEAVMADPDLADRVVLRIQCSEPLAGYNPPARAAVDRLADYPCCSLIHGPLGVEDFAREVFSTDIVWVKYRPENYFARGSGIVMEAFSAGKHILYSDGMFVDQMDDMGLALPVSTIDDCLRELRSFASDLEARRAAGAGVGRRMMERYSAAAYLRRMVNRERGATFLARLPAGIGRESYPLLVHPPTRPINPAQDLHLRGAGRA